MATGTGKTRTTMGLIDVFMRSNQARRILFVADRDALVEQAKTDGFEKFIPNEPCTRLHSWDIDTHSAPVCGDTPNPEQYLRAVLARLLRLDHLR